MRFADFNLTESAVKDYVVLYRREGGYPIVALKNVTLEQARAFITTVMRPDQIGIRVLKPTDDLSRAETYDLNDFDTDRETNVLFSKMYAKLQGKPFDIEVWREANPPENFTTQNKNNGI
jgi:hypothetical protein